MFTDSQTFSPLVLGLAANVLGYAAPLAFFLPLRRLITEAYFDDWLAAYACLAIAAACSIPYWVDTPLLTMALTGFATAGCGLLLRIPSHLARRQPPDRLLAGLGTALVAVSWAATLAWPSAGQWLHTTPALVALVLTKLWVAVAFHRHREAFTGSAGSWLAAAFLLDGLWLLALPGSAMLDRVGLALLVSGALHGCLGLGLAVALVINGSTLLREHEAARTRQERLVTDMVGTVSHELRTPLTVLKMSAWMLEEGLREPGLESRRALAADMLAATDRLAHFLDRLMDLAQHEHGQVTYALEPGCLAELVQEVVTDMRPLFTERGIELQATDEGPVPARFDPQLMRQVLLNLLGNALKFTPAGGQVFCLVRRTERGGHVTVRDTGPGIAPDDSARIFTRFYRGPHGKKGLGLGLALSKMIVEDGHRGRVWVESTPGLGATFHLTLPAPSRALEGSP